MARTRNPNSNTSRRRTWAGSGCMPPDVACVFSEGERAAMSVIAFICATRGTCDAAIGDISQQAGVGPTTVKRALRAAIAGAASLVAIEDRGNVGLTNIVSIREPSWLAWMSEGKWFGPADFRRRW